MTNHIHLLLNKSYKTPKDHIINHENTNISENWIKSCDVSILPLSFGSRSLTYLTNQANAECGQERAPRIWCQGGAQLAGTESTWKCHRLLASVFFRGWETLLSNVSERSPTIIIGTWSFPSVCGMPRRNGLAKAYKHVTTQVTLFQKHATPPRATGWIIRNYSRDKREPPINPKAFPPIYKHLSYMAQMMANLTDSSINDTPLRVLLCYSSAVATW